MTWFIIFLGIILIVVAPFIDEKIKKKKEEEERLKKEEEKRKMEDIKRRRLEEEERIAKQRRARERREFAEKQKLLQEEREKERKDGQKRFDDELSAIPIVDFQLAEPEEYINNNLALDMDEIKITMPKNGGKRSSFGSFVVVDVETTGLKLRSEIIELSAIKYYDFEPIEAFSTLIKPSNPIPAEASLINHITDEMVENAPTIKQVMPAFIDFVGKSNMLGHNIEFDLKFLYKYGFDFQQQSKRRYYDTLEIARKKLVKLSDNEENFDVASYKLDSICIYYDVFRATSHRSLSDCYATAQVFIKLLSEYDLLTEADY